MTDQTPREFKPGDRVRVADDATWTDGYVSRNLMGARGTVRVVKVGEWIEGDVPLEGGASVAPKYLTLVEPEPTDEQRAAWQAVVSTMPNTAAVVAPLLPDALTNPQPALPTKPGAMTADDPTYDEVIAAAAPVARPFLDAIQARADAASPAPWDWNDDNDGQGPEPHWTVSNGYPEEDAATLHTGEWLSKADAVFIAHARQDVPALLAALAAERARADQAADDLFEAEQRTLTQIARAGAAEARADQAERELAEWDEWENEAAGQMHPSWDGDEAQISILNAFIKHAARLDAVIEDAREADKWSGRQLAFVWDDETRTLSAVPTTTP